MSCLPSTRPAGSPTAARSYVVPRPPQSVRRLPDGTERWRYDAAGSQGEPVNFLPSAPALVP
ncbi:MAG: hypothetical protein WKG07_05795 [Hymenobacter sp.]